MFKQLLALSLVSLASGAGIVEASVREGPPEAVELKSPPIADLSPTIVQVGQTRVVAMAFSDAGTNVVSYCADGRVLRWRAGQPKYTEVTLDFAGERLRPAEVMDSDVRSSLSADGSTVVRGINGDSSKKSEGVIQVWDSASGKAKKLEGGWQTFQPFAAISGHGDWMLAFDADEHLVRVRTADQPMARSPVSSKASSHSREVVLSGDGKWMVVPDDRARAGPTLFDLEAGKAYPTWGMYQLHPKATKENPLSELGASATSDNYLFSRDARYVLHARRVEIPMDAKLDGKLHKGLVVDHMEFNLFNRSDLLGKFGAKPVSYLCVRQPGGLKESLTIAGSSDCRLVVIAKWQSDSVGMTEFCVYDLAEKRALGRIAVPKSSSKENERRFSAMAVSPDGTMIVAAIADPLYKTMRVNHNPEIDAQVIYAYDSAIVSWPVSKLRVSWERGWKEQVRGIER